MKYKILQTLSQDCRFHRGCHVLVAVSGGADSVALLRGLACLSLSRGWRLSVAHLNHGLRGTASNADAAFVKRLCATLKIPCILGRSPVRALSRRKGLSLEMAAREVRYRFLVAAAKRCRADMIATAHTADDQAETVLLKMIRGAGPQGLGGIPPETSVGGMCIVRPFLSITRVDVERFLTDLNQEWCTDETNADPAFLRNRVRHELLPFLETRFNPRIRESLRRCAEILREENAWMDKVAANTLKEMVTADSHLDLEQWSRSPVALRRRILRGWILSVGLNIDALDFEAVKRLETLAAGRKGSASMSFPGRIIIIRAYGLLMVPIREGAGRIADVFAARTLKVPGVTTVPEKRWKMKVAIRKGIYKGKASRPGGLPARATLRFTQASDSLIIRPWRAGDRIFLRGLGRKKIHDILVDAKIPRHERMAIPVVATAKGIVWLPGYRVASDWEVPEEEAHIPQIQCVLDAVQ